jgi:hypothetical protein
VVRVNSPTRPDARFEPVEPDLEDVYFSALFRHDRRDEELQLEAAR